MCSLTCGDLRTVTHMRYDVFDIRQPLPRPNDYKSIGKMLCFVDTRNADSLSQSVLFLLHYGRLAMSSCLIWTLDDFDCR